MIEISEKDFRNLSKNLKTMDVKIQRNFTKRLRKVTKEVVVPAVQTAVMSVPSEAKSDIHVKNRQGVGLRASIASSVKVAIKAAKNKSGVFLRVDHKTFEALSQRTGKHPERLPKYLDGRRKNWKHPVFGRGMDKPEHWKKQTPHPFFGRTIWKFRPEFVTEVQKAVIEAFEELEKKNI